MITVSIIIKCSLNLIAVAGEGQSVDLCYDHDYDEEDHCCHYEDDDNGNDDDDSDVIIDIWSSVLIIYTISTLLSIFHNPDITVTELRNITNLTDLSM